jgi:hypothetical protein
VVLANDRGQSGAYSRKDPCEVLFERVLNIAAAGTERHDALSLHTAASQEQATIAHRAEQDGAGGRQISIRIEIFGDAYSMGPYCLVYIVVSITMKISNRVDFIDKALIIKQYPLNCHCGFEGDALGLS